MEYLIFLKYGGGLILAIAASLYFWSKGFSNKIEKPIKTEEGDFLVTKFGELEGIESDGLLFIQQEQPIVEPIEPIVETIAEEQTELADHIVEANEMVEVVKSEPIEPIVEEPIAEPIVEAEQEVIEQEQTVLERNNEIE